MGRYTILVGLRISEPMSKGLDKVAKEIGITRSQAARYLLRKQLKYLRLVESRQQRGMSDEGYDRVAAQVRKQNPDFSEKRLAYAIAERAGRFVDMQKVKAAASRAAEKKG